MTKHFLSTNKMLYVLIMVLFLVFSCKENQTEPQPDQPTVELQIPSTENLTPVFTQQGGKVSISFTAGTDWTASVVNSRADEWINLSPSSGSKGEHVLTISAQANESYDERNATVILKCGDDSENIVITQKQKDALTVTSSKFEVDSKGGNITVEVKANINYEVEVKADWIKQNEGKSRALTTSSLSFTVDANETGDKREGEIVVKSNNLTETIKVYQGFEDFITLTKKEFTVSENGGDIDIEIKSTVDYGVKMLTDADWITEVESRAVSTHTHHYTVLPNESYNSREAKIVFYSYEDENMADTVSVCQMFKGAIIIAKNEYVVGIKGGRLDFKVESNIDFDVETSVSWIKAVSPSRSLTEHKLSFEILENTDKQDRTGKITIKAKDRELKQEIVIIQKFTDIQREILMELYNATGGDNWNNKDGWGTDLPIKEWYGVKLDHNGNICYLNLPWNNLKGSIPESFFNLRDLTWINFEGNELTGLLPEQFGEYTNVTFLGLASNSFTGSIPESFSNLTKLTYLSLSHNNLTGYIPEAMEEMPNWSIIEERLEPQNPGYGFTDVSTVEMIDLGNDLYLHPNGYAIEWRYGSKSIIPTSEIQEKMKYIYTKFNDEFDFLCMIFNVQNPMDLGSGTNAGEFMSINNTNIEGLGNVQKNESHKFGSNDKLKGMIAIFSRNTIGVFLHEYAHYYGAIDIGQIYVAPDGNAYPEGVHWGISSVHGVLGGFDLNTLERNVDNNPKKYRASCASSSQYFLPGSMSNTSFSPLELYTMGFIPAEEVPDIYIYEGVSVTSTENPYNNGVFYAEREKKVTINDIINKYGERVPDYKNAQKSFRVLTLVATDEPVNDREWDKIEEKLLPLEMDKSGINNYPSFKEATGGRGTLFISGLKDVMK